MTEPVPVEPSESSMLGQILKSARVQALIVSVASLWASRVVDWLKIPPEDAALYLDLALAVATAAGAGSVVSTIKKLRKNP